VDTDAVGRDVGDGAIDSGDPFGVRPVALGFDEASDAVR
jgi:hypothetical protein